MKNNKIMQLAYAALFASLIFAGTQFVKVPLSFGYGHLGDCFVLLVGIFIESPYATASAVVGSVLADILSGYAVYLPATLVAKLSMVSIVKAVIRVGKKDKFSFVPFLTGAMLAEMTMIICYFAYDTVLYGLGGALASLLGNAVQGVLAIVMATALISVIRHSGLRKYL